MAFNYINKGEVLKDDLGNKANLTTTAKGNLVGAINELDDEIGDLSTLTTTEKNTIVGAINEVKESVAPVDIYTRSQIDTMIQDYTSGKKLRYITQAEYNALSDTEKQDETTVYNITDAEDDEFATDDEVRQAINDIFNI